MTNENGATGLGETSPLPGFSEESLESSAEQIVSLCPHLLGKELTKGWTGLGLDLSQEIERARLAPSARFGIELAIYELYAALEGKSLPEVLCPAPVASVPVNGLLAGPVDEVIAEGYRMRRVGYEAVKLKVGRRSVQEDAEVVRSLRDVLGEDVELRLDANRTWSFAEATSFLRATEDVAYNYIEEPLADPLGLDDLARDYGALVALDESLAGMVPEGLERHDYARTVVIKPTLVGGISRTLRLTEEAHRLGITPVISSAYEAGVGTGALVALSAATGGGRVAAGLDTYRRLGADVFHPPLNIGTPRVELDGTLSAGRKLCRSYLSVLHSSES